MLWSYEVSVNYSGFFRTFMPSQPFYAGPEGGNCQRACHPQWFFYVPNWDRTNVNTVLWFTIPNFEDQVFLTPNACHDRVLNPDRQQANHLYAYLDHHPTGYLKNYLYAYLDHHPTGYLYAYLDHHPTGYLYAYLDHHPTGYLYAYLDHHPTGYLYAYLDHHPTGYLYAYLDHHPNGYLCLPWYLPSPTSCHQDFNPMPPCNVPRLQSSSKWHLTCQHLSISSHSSIATHLTFK